MPEYTYQITVEADSEEAARATAIERLRVNDGYSLSAVG